MKSRIMSIECKAGGLTGDARIGRVLFSKTGKSLYYANQTFQSLKENGFKVNFHHVESGEHPCISGPRKNGCDRLYGERLPTIVDDDVSDEYWTQTRVKLKP